MQITFFKRQNTTYGKLVDEQHYINNVINNQSPTKEECHYYLFQSIQHKNRARNEDYIQSNNYLFIDIDGKNNTKYTPQQIKDILCGLPWTKYVNISYTQTGVHAIVYVEGICQENYKLYWDDFTSFLFSNYDIRVDINTRKSANKTCCGSDKDIYINNQPSSYTLRINDEDRKAIIYLLKEERKNQKENSNLEGKVFPSIEGNLNDDFIFDDLYLKLNKNGRLFNYVAYPIFLEGNFNLIKWDNKFEWDEVNNMLNPSNLDYQYIKKQPYTNKNKTLAYFPEGVICFKLNLNKKNKWKRGNRSKNIKSFALNYIWLNRFNIYRDFQKKGIDYQMKFIWNLVTVLGEIQCETQLSIFERKSLTYAINACIIENAIKPRFTQRKSAISEGFYMDNDEANPLKFYLKELNQAKRNYIQGTRKELYFEIKKLNPDFNRKQIVLELSSKLNLKPKTINNWLSANMKVDFLQNDHLSQTKDLKNEYTHYIYDSGTDGHFVEKTVKDLQNELKISRRKAKQLKKEIGNKKSAIMELMKSGFNKNQIKEKLNVSLSYIYKTINQSNDN